MEFGRLIRPLAHCHPSNQIHNSIPAHDLMMWNNKRSPDDGGGDGESWEVRAFEEDTLGCTWPPRSYTCAFCRREFRSAQALGGHMNVHRRDRARMHHDVPPQSGVVLPSFRSVSDAPPSLLIPAATSQEFYASRLCFLYPHNTVLTPTSPVDLLPSPAGLLPTSTDLAPNGKLPADHTAVNGVFFGSRSTEPSPPNSNDDNSGGTGEGILDIDLELRLGRRSTP